MDGAGFDFRRMNDFADGKGAQRFEEIGAGLLVGAVFDGLREEPAIVVAAFECEGFAVASDGDEAGVGGGKSEWGFGREHASARLAALDEEDVSAKSGGEEKEDGGGGFQAEPGNGLTAEGAEIAEEI